MKIMPNLDGTWDNEPQLPDLGENEILRYIIPANKKINDCKKFSCTLYDEIECLKNNLAGYKQLKGQFFIEITKLIKGKKTSDWYDRYNLDCMLVRKYYETIDVINLYIEDIEKLLEEKVNQYKKEEQKPPEDKSSEIKKSILQPQSHERHIFLDKFDVFKTMVDDLASIGAIERPNNKDIEIIFNDNFVEDLKNVESQN